MNIVPQKLKVVPSIDYILMQGVLYCGVHARRQATMRGLASDWQEVECTRLQSAACMKAGDCQRQSDEICAL